jgi:predicted glycosyltransferase involved in capsule biosynthesis
MEDLKDIDIIVATRIDNHERAMNAFLMYKFFKDHTINSKFIFVEDSTSPILQGCIPIEDTDKIYFEQNGYCDDPGMTHELKEGFFRKCRSYNIGIEKSDRKFLLFLDLDCVVNPKQIIGILDKIKKKRRFGICYNGQPAYLNYNAKQKFADAPLFSTLEGFHPDSKLLEVALDNRRRGFPSWPDSLKYEHCKILGVNACGGCLLGMKKDFIKIGGFNENFAGWGYEDTEIISRIRILYGKSPSLDWEKDHEPFYRCENKEDFLFHFPHTKESVTSRQVVLTSNKQESDKVEGMNTKELTKYIKKWTWLK